MYGLPVVSLMLTSQGTRVYLFQSTHYMTGECANIAVASINQNK